MRRMSTILALVLWLAGSPERAWSTSSTPRGDTLVDFQWGVAIALRDGTRLSATVYTPPRGQSQPAACVFSLTPYIADSGHDRGVYFASHGLSYVIVDARGRGNSEGIYRPHLQEARDGYDVVEWLAHQPYCNGKVAMYGGSYGGYDQWMIAKELPPHLATIVPVAAPYMGVDFPMRSNIFYSYVMQWLTLVSGRAEQAKIFSDDAFWSTFYRRWYESGLPFRDLDVMLGNPSPVFHEWIAHPERDAYWDQYNPTAADYARLQVPILTITGSYDDDQAGALEHYRQYMLNASPDGRSRHYLVIGPWDHAGTRDPKAEVGGIRFGPASLVDLLQLNLDWYNWTMAGQPKPGFLKKNVAYYVMGAERWRYADTLEGITATSKPLFLDSMGEANDVLSSGQLRDGPSRGGSDSYSYDPRIVSGPEIDAEAHTNGDALTDQTVLFALRGKELVYHTAPFERDTEISGFFKLTAWISIDCPDTDFYVSVYEIARDGSSINLASDAIRARYRQGPRTPVLIRSSKPLQYDFDRFTFVSREVKRSSRLRLVIAPMGHLAGTTFPERNFNSGGVVANERLADARTVTVRLYHDRAHPSALYIPIGQTD
jgi:putative CocE/NonD family hydrolase